MANKGAPFERELCRQLSEWFSEDTADDWFWRSSNSGGRATVRARKGQRTFGHQGDIAATHPSGRALLDKVTIEAKRGYNRYTIADLLDAPKHAALQGFDKFFLQAEEAAKKAGTPYWWLIVRRDQRDAMLYMPRRLLSAINDYVVSHEGVTQASTVAKWEKMRLRSKERIVSAGRLDEFLKTFHPRVIREIS